MTDPRRYDEHEVEAILARAAADETGPAPVHGTVDRGLTLAQLQEVGAEVGLSPARIAEAARALDSRLPEEPRRSFLGAPRSVSRTVAIERPLTDDEWNRLVADLRRTFDAQGRIQAHGDLRSWSNGNLQVHVEPDADRYRLRMRTFKGSVTQALTVGGALLFSGVMMLLTNVFGGGGTSTLGHVLTAAFMLGGLGVVGWSRAALPGWAERRAQQMEALAERLPLLIED